VSASSLRYGFELPESTRVAITIYEGAHLGRSAVAEAPGPLLNIGSGDPGFVTPAHVRETAKRAIDAGKTHYERNADLRQAIAAKLSRDHALTVDPDDGLVVTPGAHLAIYDVFRAWVGAGDEVLMGDPGSYYDANTRANGGVPVHVPLRPERGFKLDPDGVEARITPRTKVLALTNPEAPCASVHDRADLERLADLAIRHDLLVISDELYEAITYEPETHVSIGSLPGMQERTLTVNGFSKAWAMTGWRVGYVAGDPRLIAPVRAVNHLNCISLNSIAQFAALAALTGPQDFLDEALATYRRRRDLVVERVRAIDGLACRVPEGSYYVWVDLRELNASDVRFQRWCVANAGITFNPGSVFGPGGAGFARLSCSPSESVLEPGLDRLAQAVTAFRDAGARPAPMASGGPAVGGAR
jgi:aspartate/methionine/tyrosine aminotransferase